MSQPVDNRQGSSRGHGDLFSEPPTTNPDSNEPSIKRVPAREGSAITKLTEPLNETNWIAWRE